MGRQSWMKMGNWKIVNAEEDEPVENGSDEEEDILDDPDFQNMSDSDGDDLPLFGNLSDEELDEEGEGTFKERERSGGGRKTEVDDQFFKMSEMEKFLDLEDKKELNKDKKEESEDEDAIDMFDEIPDSKEAIMYREYFDNKENHESDEEDEDEDEDEDEIKHEGSEYGGSDNEVSDSDDNSKKKSFQQTSSIFRRRR